MKREDCKMKREGLQDEEEGLQSARRMGRGRDFSRRTEMIWI
jgi:hypothetical protein